MVAMLVASLEATAGSVMQNADLILPSSSGRSQRSCCCGEPNSASTSMLPVSGAAQFRASGASAGLQPGDLGQRRVLQVGQRRIRQAASRQRRDGLRRLAGQEEVPQPAAARLGLEFLGDGHPLPRMAAGRRPPHLLREHRLGRVDPLFHERKQPLTQIKRPGVVAEVHGAQPPDGPLPQGSVASSLPTHQYGCPSRPPASPSLLPPRLGGSLSCEFPHRMGGHCTQRFETCLLKWSAGAPEDVDVAGLEDLG